jgi:hypothetical protein
MKNEVQVELNSGRNLMDSWCGEEEVSPEFPPLAFFFLCPFFLSLFPLCPIKRLDIKW